MARVIALQTYLNFAKKYKIDPKGKTMKELAKGIYKYEMKYIYPSGKKKGLYVI